MSFAINFTEKADFDLVDCEAKSEAVPESDIELYSTGESVVASSHKTKDKAMKGNRVKVVANQPKSQPRNVILQWPPILLMKIILRVL